MTQKINLFLFLISYNLFYQDSCVGYLFIENNKTNYYYEKLFLYNNTEFFRIRYNGHIGYSSHERGNWNIREDSLKLNRKEIKLFPENNDSVWELDSNLEIHLIKRNWIYAYGKYKLKRQKKKCQ